MRLLSDSGRSRVPFEFINNTVILKVTRYTTFNDVVHLLTHKAGIPKSSAKLYAVYESTYDLERKIGGEVRVLNIWRSWGSESTNFRFVVKRADGGITMKQFSRSPSAKTEQEIDVILSKTYREVNLDMFAEDTRDSHKATKPEVKSEMNQLSRGSLGNHKCKSLANTAFNLDKTNRKDDSTSTKTSSVTVGKHSEVRGKRVLLARYFNDLKVFGKRKTKKLGKRLQADGAEVPEVLGGRHVEGREDNCTVSPRVMALDTTAVSMANCRYHWERHSESDTDSDISEDSLELEPETDEESDVSDMFLPAPGKCALDTAFVKSSRCSESDEGIDVTSMASSDLNTAFVADFARKCTSEEEYSELVYSLGDFEKNISTADYVRRIFGADETQSVGSQDDEVDSFMRTRLDSF